MYLDRLRQELGRAWPHLEAARQAAGEVVHAIRKRLATGPALDSYDASLVVFGSLGRGEWTRASDLDWTLLIDGQADHEHALTAQHFGRLMEEMGLKKPGQTGVFGNIAFSHNIIHQIGGQDDSNRNTTQRLLLLLESRALGRDEAHERVMQGTLSRYLADEVRGNTYKVPRFLCNDMVRFWRTMAVDYAQKYRERAGGGWALRYVKLRMSRKLLFVAGLLTCFGCDPELLAQSDSPLLKDPPSMEALVAHLREYVRRPPLELLAEALARHAQPETAAAALDAYDTFLAHLDDANDRQHLEALNYADSERDPLFQVLQENSRTFQRALQQLFFRDSPVLFQLVQDYGVF
jgi:hypothetical protein